MGVHASPNLKAVPHATAKDREADAQTRERICAKTLRLIAGFVIFCLAANFAVLLWAQHEFTPVESIVSLHANMFAHGQGLYFNLNRFPFTVSAYGPIFYGLSGYFHRLGVPAYQSGRLISFAALLAAFWLGWRSLRILTDCRFARLAGLLLAASTANLLYWGTVGQTDALAMCFSLAAFHSYLRFRKTAQTKSLLAAGAFVILAIFTKQTALAAPAAIALSLLFDRKIRVGVLWSISVAAAVAAIAFTLNTMTHGGYFANAIFANINPMAWFKLQQQGQYLLLTGAGVILIAVVGARFALLRTLPIYIYGGLSSAIFLATAAKIGSDLNYQMEMMLVLSLCAGTALGQIEFFPSLFSARRTWVTLLQMPLLLHVALNILLSLRTAGERAVFEPIRQQETETLKPYTTRPGRLLSVHYDSLVQDRGSIEVEPLIYTMLVRAGLSDPHPLTEALATRQFQTLILNEDLFAPTPIAIDAEFPRFPGEQIEAIRQNYRMVKHVDGPYGVFVYQPKTD